MEPNHPIPTSPANPTTEPTHSSTELDRLALATTVLKAAGLALSARALLLLSLVGAFVLAMQAMSSQTIMALEVLGAYGVFTVLPVTYLETRRGRE